MIRDTRVGLLPLYLELYDEVRPEARPEMEAFAARVQETLEALGLDVVAAPVLTKRAQIEERVRAMLGDEALDALATVHLAYSPSLEATGALVEADRPLLLLDTTPASSFGEDADADRMFRNHGIHGVQDLACMMRRHERPYLLSVGHIDDAAFHADVTLNCRAMRAARELSTMRVLSVGDAFEGMGDFAVEAEVLRKRLGVNVHPVSVGDLAQVAGAVTGEELAEEAARDAGACDCSEVAPEALERTNRVGLAVRRMMEDTNAGAVTFNFASFTGDTGIDTVPFLEASKAMARGKGYAGENDPLTAAMVGALAQAGCRLTFTEMFCPDWEGGTVFMSHMGECSLAVADGRPKLVEKSYGYSDVANPVVVIPKVAPGEATLVNLAPGPRETFTLITARVEVLDRGPVAGFPGAPHFWLRPLNTDLRGFLQGYSEIGGTHHLGMCLGDERELVRRMAKALDLRYCEV
ncbi:MAG: L-arabinose isomerase family protein [Armatimonadota bacterium]|jgi:L-arabinose isomerase